MIPLRNTEDWHFCSAGLYLQKNLMGMDGEEEIFFKSTVSWCFSLFQQVKLTGGGGDPVALLIWIDVTVTHRAMIWSLLSFQGERIISVFQVKCALMKVIIFSMQKKALHFCSQRPYWF